MRGGGRPEAVTCYLVSCMVDGRGGGLEILCSLESKIGLGR